MLGGVYLAYPIDQRGPSSLVYLFDQIDRFKRDVVDHDLAKWVFDPGDAFTVGKRAEPDDSLPRVNRAALIAADLVVAFIPAGVPSLGVPMEIDRAHAMGKHVMVFSEVNTWMLTLPNLWKANGYQDEHINEGLAWVQGLAPLAYPPMQYQELKYVGEREFAPSRTYEDDAGLDLYVSEDTLVPQGTFVDVPCGISCELPEGTWGLVAGRSSALRRRGILVHPGVIDVGYRGPLFAGAYAMNEPVQLKRGERIAQLIIVSNATRRTTPVQAQELSPSRRGTRGFGSTGA